MKIKAFDPKSVLDLDYSIDDSKIIPNGNNLGNYLESKYYSGLKGYARKYPLAYDGFINTMSGNGPTVTLNSDIKSHSLQTQIDDAKGAKQALSKIHDYDATSLNDARVHNLPDIIKFKQYTKDSSGHTHISPTNGWLDLKGKSDSNIIWDRNYWRYYVAGGDPNLDDNVPSGKITKSNRASNRLPHEMYWFNYHANKLDKYSNNPYKVGTKKWARRNTLYNQQLAKMSDWQSKMNNAHKNCDDSLNDELHWAQGWLQYHQNKLKHHPRSKYQKNQVKRWQKVVKDKTNSKNQDWKYYQAYQREAEQRQYNEKMRWDQKQINAQVQANNQNDFTSIYRADGQDPHVVRVAEISPTEEIQYNVPTKSVDDGLPQTDWVQKSGQQLNGQYMLYLPDDWTYTADDMQYGDKSPSYNQRVSQYNILKNWADSGDQLNIRGFNSWNTILVSDLQRGTDQSSSGNGLSLQVTFQKVRLAHIKYSANKKAPAKPMTGRHNRKHPNNGKVKIKAGNTFYGFAKKFGGTVGEWEHANPHARATDLRIGGKLNKPAEAK